ncbi:hypothetical protein H8E88_06150 [candidate division KSB1 bacterium]|nr:hypothetical protein [candidate division KSB1 bacterium]
MSVIPDLLIELKVALEGPYNTATDEMNTNLNTLDYIPLTSPYAQDARTVASIPADIVDWVLVELRCTLTGAAAASRSAFLHKDGRIVADDGTTGQIIIRALEGDYYIVVRHRNHLDIISSTAVSLNAATSTLYDFTTGTDKAYTDNVAEPALKLLDSAPTTVYGMFGGDANPNNIIAFMDDMVKLAQDRTKTEYIASDVNMDGTVTYHPIDKDFQIIRANNLCESKVE